MIDQSGIYLQPKLEKFREGKRAYLKEVVQRVIVIPGFELLDTTLTSCEGE
jgi:hypothetical protein